jgi:hypothetical protein
VTGFFNALSGANVSATAAVLRFTNGKTNYE